MVNLITGNVNQGKTRFIRSLYEKNRQGDGFISVKIFKGKEFRGYDILRLSNGAALPFAYKLKFLPEDWDEIFRHGRFSFSGKAFKFADNIITFCIEQGISPIFIDEIGSVEITNGRGFYHLLKRVLPLNREIFLTVRRQFIKDLIEVFKIDKYKVIEV